MPKIVPTKTPMPEQDPAIRRRNYFEVPLGYTPEQAIEEARRCLQCKKPECIAGCPVEINIPGFLALVADGRFIEAAHLVKQANALPAVTGRVCPQEEQCEVRCALAKKFESVGIGRLERFVADWEAAHGEIEVPAIAPATGKRVAVVGSGPAGITVAADLAVMGHAVKIFEALHEPGGVLVYGIPEFRLPKAIVEQASIESLIKSGFTVIAVGGGGIPVIEDEAGDLVGSEAVIDKDYASSLLASSIKADLFLISTAVEKVALNFNKSDQQWLERMTLAEAKRYYAEGHFAKGSMGPKIQAIIWYLERGGRQALITNPENIGRSLRGETGTWITG